MIEEFITPDVARLVGITHHDLRQLVRRDLLLFPNTSGQHEKAPRIFTREGLYEVVILSALHSDLGVTWPKAAAVFKHLASMLAESNKGHRRWHVPAKVAHRALMEHRDDATPALLLFTFVTGEVEAFVQVVEGWDSLRQTIDGIRRTGSSAGDGFGFLNLTTLLMRVDATLAAMEAE